MAFIYLLLFCGFYVEHFRETKKRTKGDRKIKNPRKPSKLKHSPGF